VGTILPGSPATLFSRRKKLIPRFSKKLVRPFIAWTGEQSVGAVQRFIIKTTSSQQITAVHEPEIDSPAENQHRRCRKKTAKITTHSLWRRAFF